jgi:hypothetical protein
MADVGFLDARLGPPEVQVEGVALTKRTRLNFTSSVSTPEDDPTNEATKIPIGGAGSTPTGTGVRKVVGGVENAAASLVLNADVDASAAIALSKLASDVAGTTATQTLTNKTINAADNTITDTGGALGDLLVHNGTKFVRLGIGTPGQVATAGAGTVAWATPGGGAPGGSSGELQYNNAGAFGGLSAFTYASDYITAAAAGVGGFIFPQAASTVAAAPLKFGNPGGSGYHWIKCHNGTTDNISLLSQSGTTFKIGDTANVALQVYGTQVSLYGAGAGVLMFSASGSYGLQIAYTIAAALPIIGEVSASSPYSVHGGVSHTFASDANYTVTAAQYAYDCLIFVTGSWTTSHTITVPAPASLAAGYYKTIINTTSYTITVSTGTGTTRNVASGQSQRFWIDSTGVRFAGSNASY